MKKDQKPALSVAAPTERIPDYSLSAGASVEEIRATAIRAMRDGLSVLWTPAENFQYVKKGSHAGKVFEYHTGTTYAGMPYTNGDTGIVAWLQYYDFETGVLSVPDFSRLNDTLGNTCASAVFCGWKAVCTGLDVGATYRMTVSNGVYPIGDYSYDPSVTDLHDYRTQRMIEEAGDEAIFEAYALCHPAYGVNAVSNKDGTFHAMMVIEEPHVVRNADGRIDPDASFLVIQDQRANHFGMKTTGEVNGETVYYSGRLRAEVSFAKLIAESYVPVAPAEIIGIKPYKPARVSASGEVSDPASLRSIRIESNYSIVAVRTVVTDRRGKVKSDTRRVLTKNEVLDFGTSYPCDRLFEKNVPGASDRLRVEVTLCNGQTFTPIDADFTA